MPSLKPGYEAGCEYTCLPPGCAGVVANTGAGSEGYTFPAPAPPVTCDLFAGAPSEHMFVNRGDYLETSKRDKTLLEWGPTFTNIYGVLDTCVACAGLDADNPSRICYGFKPAFNAWEVLLIWYVLGIALFLCPPVPGPPMYIFGGLVCVGKFEDDATMIWATRDNAFVGGIAFMVLNSLVLTIKNESRSRKSMQS